MTASALTVVLRTFGIGLAGTAFLVAVVLSLWLGYWRLQGKTVLSVESSSMVPTFKHGDAVVVDTAARQWRAGQVVSFYSPTGDGVIVNHRLVAADDKLNRYITQGDASNASDAALRKESIIGVVTGVLPGFGRLLHYMRSPLGLIVSVYLPCSWLLYHELQRAIGSWSARPYLFYGWRTQAQRH